MPDIALPWGGGELNLSLPENWTVQQVARPELRPAPENWPERMAGAFNQPDTHQPLPKLLAARRGGRICVVVEDLTRHSPLPQILQVLLREFQHARIDNDQVEFVFATGMHPPLAPAQAVEKLSPEIAQAYSWRNNPWHDRSQYAYVGQAGNVEFRIDRRVLQADLRILISSVSPHLQAGFGGGYKMLIPGCSSLETIRSLHRLGVGRDFRQLVGVDAAKNTMRSAVDAAGQLIDASHGTTFAVQYLLDERNLPTFVAAGEPIPTQRMLAKQCAVSCGIVVNAPADVLVTNSHPRDFDLWQSFKGIANTLWAARKDGIILCLSRCEAGLNGMRNPPWPLSPRRTRKLLKLLGPDALSSFLTRLVPGLSGDAAFFVRMAARILHRNPIYLVSPGLYETGAGFPGMEIFPSADRAIAAIEELRGRQPQRVVVFPAGGITFPIPSGAFTPPVHP
jgi:hypothetical protein